MSTLGAWLGWLVALTTLLYVLPDPRHGSRRPMRHGRHTDTDDVRQDECALFKATVWETMRDGASFLEIGRFDVDDEVEVSFDVLPDPGSLDGVLLAVGTEGFQYYRYQAYNTQFFVIEFSYSALSVLVKARNETHLVQMEIFKTYPKVYNVADGGWHNVRVSRDRKTKQWYLYLDRVYTVTFDVSSKTDVQLYNRPTYIGGRPDYVTKQFRGVMKNLYVNKERISLHGLPSRGNAHVWHCSAPEIRSFIREIRGLGPEEEVEEDDDVGDFPFNITAPPATSTTERNWKAGHLDV